MLLNWIDPGFVVKRLLQKNSLMLSFFLVALIVFSFILEAILFFSLSDVFPIQVVWSVKGCKIVFFVFLSLFTGLYTLLHFLTLPVWGLARSLGGEGDLPETRMALIWTVVPVVFFCFFSVLLQLTFKKPDFVCMLGVKILAYLGLISSLIYALIAMGKTVAEAQKFSFFRGFLSSAVGALFFGWIIYALFVIARAKFF